MYNLFTHSTAQICEEFRRSRETLRYMIDKGILVEGRDFIRKTPAPKRPTYLWNPSKVQKAIEKALGGKKC